MWVTDAFTIYTTHKCWMKYTHKINIDLKLNLIVVDDLSTAQHHC